MMRKKFRTQHGGMVVELAMVLPFLLLFLVVTADLGLLLRAHQIITNGAREGARFSALPKNYFVTNPELSVTAIQQHVADYCAEEGITINLSDVVVDQTSPVTVQDGILYASRVRVHLTQSVLFLGGFSGPDSFTLSSEAKFVNLY